MKVDLEKLTGVKKVETLIKSDIRISVRYDAGKCYLEGYINSDNCRKSCHLALDLVDMGFWITEIEMRRVRADKVMTVDDFACLYHQAEKIREGTRHVF